MYFIRRLIISIPLLVFISFISFLLMHAAPGGPFDKERKPASPEVERNLARKFHFDESFTKQYLRYLGVGWEHDKDGKFKWFQGGLIRGDFGPSYLYRNHSVNDIIAAGMPVSLPLGLMAFGLAMGLGIPAGFYTALRRGEWQDYAGTFLAVLGVCIPGLVLGPMLVVIFAIRLRWFPVALWGSPWHVVLPVIALGLAFAGHVTRLMREGMLNVMKSEFITTARAKGLDENTLLMRHGLRIAILPVISYAGPLLADLLTGSFVIEKVFAISGLGLSIVNGSLNRDYLMVIGLVLLYATLLIVLNLLVDLAYLILDPRVKYE